MFILKSYLKRPSAKITSLQDINQRAEDYFINIDDKDSILKIKDKIEPNYIEGVIYLEYYGVILMDFTYWDLIDYTSWEMGMVYTGNQKSQSISDCGDNNIG